MDQLDLPHAIAISTMTPDVLDHDAGFVFFVVFDDGYFVIAIVVHLPNVFFLDEFNESDVVAV